MFNALNAICMTFYVFIVIEIYFLSIGSKFFNVSEAIAVKASFP